MSKEAMKQALDFIERINKDGWMLADFEPQMYAAITALREALAQPAQRTWVGLTDEEIDMAIGFFGSFGARQDARAIEAKLKGQIEHLAELVRADEREACAKVIESHGPHQPYGAMFAAAIRARSNI